MKNFEYEDWLDDDGYPTDKALKKLYEMQKSP